MQKENVWRVDRVQWALFLAVVAITMLAFRAGLVDLWNRWQAQEEYSHGQLIPVISLFLVFQLRGQLQRLEFNGAWIGAAIVAFGCLLLVLGQLSTITALVYYGLWFTLIGLTVSWVGLTPMKLLWVPLAYLFFMIPLPGFFYNTLSAKLQLLSSEIGVAVIRWFGVSVFLEGNVIDLGSYKLQVVEACNGLRYLFPLMSFGFLCAYLFKAPVWQKAIVFFATIPITVLMNSFRIGVIGVTVDRWGQEMAEGFLHDFEGWVIFMACLAVLFALMYGLKLIANDKRSFDEVFAVDMGASHPQIRNAAPRKFPPQFLATAVIIAVALLVSLGFESREQVSPSRATFADFPMSIGDWQGSRGEIEKIYLDQLKLTDYVIADYSKGGTSRVNFYVAYYASQRTGESAHSPRSCLPGGGWEIKSLEETNVATPQGSIGESIDVNRAEIQYGDQRQLVYYWFQQRGRVITNEYLVKWFLFWDSLTRNRSDGALVRLVAPVAPTESINDVDAELQQFVADVYPELIRYVPN